MLPLPPRASRRVAQHEVPGARVGALHRAIPARLERTDRRRDVALLDDDIEIAVSARLSPEARVDGPAAVEPHPDAVGAHQIQKRQDVAGGHHEAHSIVCSPRSRTPAIL
jgi:hypothetical protein